MIRIKLNTRLHILINALILLIERNRIAEERVDDIGVIVELLVNHESEDTHHGGSAIVELDGCLSPLGLLVPTE